MFFFQEKIKTGEIHKYFTLELRILYNLFNVVNININRSDP